MSENVQEIINDDDKQSDASEIQNYEAPKNEENRIHPTHNTDIGNAKRFAEQHRHRVRYYPEANGWLVNTGDRWVMDSGELIMPLVKQTIDSIYIEAEKTKSLNEKAELMDHIKRSCNHSRVKAMLGLARWENGIVVHANQLDADPWLLNCQNGTIDLKTGQLLPHDPDHLITRMAPVTYNREATCPIFDRFICHVAGGDQSKIDFLKRIVGYTLTGSTKEQCLFILYGRGANGKSTLIEIFRELMGDYALNTPAESLLSGKSIGIRNDIARLHRSRFVSAVEVGIGRKLDESLVKALTGGDQVTARFLYKEHFDFKPEFKLLLAVNHLPQIAGTDDGIWRRIHVVPFDVSIPSHQMDRDLFTKLQSELPGILNWALSGCREWQEQGLNPPPCVTRHTSLYHEDMDFLSEFISDRCTVEHDKKVPLGELYTAFNEWTDDVCMDPVGKKIFGNLMKQRGYRQMKSNGTRYWRGIGLSKQEQGLLVASDSLPAHRGDTQAQDLMS